MLMRIGQGISPNYSAGLKFLSNIIPSTIADLDATIAASYDGSSQTWKNLIASPADGSAQSDNDFYLGASATATTDDPTFTGSAGDKAAYFLMDGGDFFTLASGVNTAFLRDMHKTTGGDDFWFAIGFNFSANNANRSLMSTSTGWLQEGMHLMPVGDPSMTMRFRQHDGAAGASQLAGGAVSTGVDILVIASHSHSLNKSRMWLNTTTALEGTHTFDTCVLDSSLMHIGSDAAGGGTVNNGTKIYNAAYGNAYLDDADAANIFAHLNARHGRAYA